VETNTISSSERAVDTELSGVKRKMHFTGVVMKTTLAGAVVDIGLSVPGVVHISQLQKEPVNRVEDVVQVGQELDVWVRRVEPKKHRIELTMIKPLEVEWKDIEEGKNFKGKVTRIEKFGIFVDIGAERPGLVHISEITHQYIREPKDVVAEGDEVEVKVLSVIRQKKQIKLSMKALEAIPAVEEKSSGKKKEKAPKQPEQPKEVEEPDPTAMELALRDAMERTKKKPENETVKGKKKSVGTDEELEKYLSRTLQNKVKTVSK
jgi:small subunit ribosomal protein S1